MKKNNETRTALNKAVSNKEEDTMKKAAQPELTELELENVRRIKKIMAAHKACETEDWDALAEIAGVGTAEHCRIIYEARSEARRNPPPGMMSEEFINSLNRKSMADYEAEDWDALAENIGKEAVESLKMIYDDDLMLIEKEILIDDFLIIDGPEEFMSRRDRELLAKYEAMNSR